MPACLARLIFIAALGCVLSACTTTDPTTTAAATPMSPPSSDAITPLPTHPEIRAALLELKTRDQAARAKLVSLLSEITPGPDGAMQINAEQMVVMNEVSAIDAESTAYLKSVVAEHGWPTKSMVAEDGAQAAWLLVQHADADPQFQAHALELMEPLLTRNEVNPRNVALLTDRVLTGRNEPQRYGTQFADDEHGVMRPLPLEDPSNVDALRAAVGLPPLAAYAEQLSTAYGQPTSVEPLPSSQ